MKVVVTGGTGLVGHGISKVLGNFPDYEVVLASSKSCNLLDFKSTKDFFAKERPDIVIHLAANVGGLFKNMNQKVSMFENNIMINMNTIRACYKAGVKRFVGVLSTCIFPDKTTYPINEEMLQAGPPHTSNDAYAYAKRMLKVQCDAYNEQYDVNYSCIIPTNIYGENDNYSLQDAHVIPALIHKCYLAKEKNEPFIVAGTGKPLRQFIHADDLAMITLRLLDHLDQDTVIVSSDEEISIKQIATYIAEAFEYEHMMKFDTTLSDGQYKKTADNTKLISLIGEYMFIDTRTGISSVVEHFINNKDYLRT